MECKARHDDRAIREKRQRRRVADAPIHIHQPARDRMLARLVDHRGREVDTVARCATRAKCSDHEIRAARNIQHGVGWRCGGKLDQQPQVIFVRRRIGKRRDTRELIDNNSGIDVMVPARCFQMLETLLQ